MVHVLGRVFKKKNEDIENISTIHEYFERLDELMTFSSDPELIKERISVISNGIISLMNSGEILPYKIAANHWYIPDEVLTSASCIEWCVNSYGELTDLIDFVYRMVNNNNLIWKIYFTRELYKYLSDQSKNSGINMQYFSHKYLWDRFVFHRFENDEGQDGSLKPIWRF